MFHISCFIFHISYLCVYVDIQNLSNIIRFTLDVVHKQTDTHTTRTNALIYWNMSGELKMEFKQTQIYKNCDATSLQISI